MEFQEVLDRYEDGILQVGSTATWLKSKQLISRKGLSHPLQEFELKGSKPGEFDGLWTITCRCQDNFGIRFESYLRAMHLQHMDQQTDGTYQGTGSPRERSLESAISLLARKWQNPDGVASLETWI